MQNIHEGKLWSHQDDDDLRHAVESGYSIDCVATFLCRPIDEVMKRKAELGVHWDGARQ
jgi:hypothetical protein